MNVTKGLIAVAILTATSAANAVPITGSFDFTISAKAIDTDGIDGVADGVADAFDFDDFGNTADGTLDNDVSVGLINSPITGTFLNDFMITGGISGDLVNVKDIAADSAAVSADPWKPSSSPNNNPYWALDVNNGNGLIGTIKFDAISASIIDGTDPLDLAVQGKMSFIADELCDDSRCVDYYESTDSTWIANHNGVNTVSATVQVPEPGTLALFGLGLVALGITRRKQPKA